MIPPKIAQKSYRANHPIHNEIEGFHTAWTQCGHLAMQAVVRSTSLNHTQVLAPDHSALMLAARITLPHFSVSSAISFPKSPGEPERTVIPRSANRALTTGLARPALIAWLSLLMTSAGVFPGAPTP